MASGSVQIRSATTEPADPKRVPTVADKTSAPTGHNNLRFASLRPISYFRSIIKGFRLRRKKPQSDGDGPQQLAPFRSTPSLRIMVAAGQRSEERRGGQ